MPWRPAGLLDRGSPGGRRLRLDVPPGLARRLPVEGQHARYVLVGTPHSHTAVLDVAAREGWRAQQVDTGLFAIVKVWVEDRFLVEFMNPEGVARYAASLGGADHAALDRHLRGHELELGSLLTAKLAPEVLRAALREPGAAGRQPAAPVRRPCRTGLAKLGPTSP